MSQRPLMKWAARSPVSILRRTDLGLQRQRAASSAMVENVNAGVKMHRLAGVKMRHG
jgi:hypothetical protein